MFDSIFGLINRLDLENDIKEVIFQVLVGNRDYSPVSRVSNMHKDLLETGRRNLWSGVFLNLVTIAIHSDILCTRRIISKICRQCILGLHRLWIARCNFIYMRSSEALMIEELTDLRSELDSLRYTELFQEFLESEDITFPKDINKVSAMVIKGWLFQFYIQMGDIESYEKINKTSILYKNNVMRDSSGFDITIRNEITTNRRQFEI